MTESEFEELLSRAMNDNYEAPPKLNERLQKKLLFKARYQKIAKAFPTSAAACLLIGVALTSLVYNNRASFELQNNSERNFRNDEAVISVNEEYSSFEEEPRQESEEIKPNVRSNEKMSSRQTKKAAVGQETEKKEKEEKRESEQTGAVAYDYAASEAAVEEEASVGMPQTAVTAAEEQTTPCNEDTTNDVSVYAGGGRSIKAKTLLDYLGNDSELIECVSESISRQIKEDSEGKYNKYFSVISGDEDYYINENGELVVIFEAGRLAPEDYGTISFNVGVINTEEEEK